MSIKEINDKIFTNYNKDQKKAVRSITKNGFVNVDGTFKQYNPKAKEFVNVTNDYLLQVLFNSMGNNWSFVSANERLEVLKNELPNLTTKDVEDFKTYLQWIDVQIDSALIKELMDNAIAENETFKTDQEFKGKYDLISQMLILRNNDIFTNGNFLLKLEDGKFKVVQSDYIRELLNDIIASPGDNIHLQWVKNNFRNYLDNLTDISELYELLLERDKRAKMITESKPGFEKCLKVVSKYQ